jgi:hypothetical protein
LKRIQLLYDLPPLSAWRQPETLPPCAYYDRKRGHLT